MGSSLPPPPSPSLRASAPEPREITRGPVPPPRIHLHNLFELPRSDGTPHTRVQHLEERRVRMGRQIESHAKILKQIPDSSKEAASASSSQNSSHVANVREYYRAQVDMLERDVSALQREIHRLRTGDDGGSCCASSSTTSQVAERALPPSGGAQWVHVRPPSPDGVTQAGYLNWLYTWIPESYDSLSSALRYVVDPRDRFKGHRYLQYTLQIVQNLGLKRLGELRESTQLLAQKPGNPDADFFSYVHAAVMVLLEPGEFYDPRNYYHSFQANIRKALLFAMNRKLETPAARELYEELMAVCAHWAGEAEMHGFLSKVVQYVAYTGDPQSLAYIQSSEPSLSAKMARALASPFECLSPPLHQLLKKGGKVLGGFSPLSDTNQPSKLFTSRWHDPDGAERTITFVRCPVPVGPKADNTAIQEFPWELQGVWVVPEILAAFQHFQAQGKKVLWFCYLNTQHLDFATETAEGITWWDLWKVVKGDPKVLLRKCESFWSLLLLRVARVFPDTLELFFITQDAWWLKHTFVSRDLEQPDQVKTFLLNRMTGKESVCQFPKSLGTGAELRDFLRGVMDKVHTEYFAHLRIWDSEAKKAFWGHFCGALQIHAAILAKADYVYGECTDAADRTMVPAAALMATSMLHQKTLNDPEEHIRFLGTVLGIALTVWKRWPLGDRADVIMSSVRHLEKLHPSTVKPWTILGHKFAGIDMGKASGDDQPLVPGPASAFNDASYTDFLQFERNNPVCLPKAVPAPELAHQVEAAKAAKEDALIEQLAKNLASANIYINNVAIQMGADPVQRYMELLKQMKLSNEGRLLAMTFTSSETLKPVLERLSKRYAHGELRYGVLSSRQQEPKHKINFVKRGKNRLMRVRSSMPLCKLLDSGATRAIADLEATVTIDLTDQSCPTFTWLIKNPPTPPRHSSPTIASGSRSE